MVRLIDALRDMIKQIGSITYGKERFFELERGIWYDRKYGDYISIEQVIERIVEAVKENEE